MNRQDLGVTINAVTVTSTVTMTSVVTTTATGTGVGGTTVTSTVTTTSVVTTTPSVTTTEIKSTGVLQIPGLSTAFIVFGAVLALLVAALLVFIGLRVDRHFGD